MLSSPQVHSSSMPGKLVGVLVTFDSNPNGEVIELRSGRWMITSKPTDLGDYIMIDDETISPLHGIIRASSNGSVQVLDQLSEYGTTVTKFQTDEEIDIAGRMITLDHGDQICFGNRVFELCLLPNRT